MKEGAGVGRWGEELLEAPPLPDNLTNQTVGMATQLQRLLTGNHGNSLMGAEEGSRNSETGSGTLRQEVKLLFRADVKIVFHGAWSALQPVSCRGRAICTRAAALYTSSRPRLH